MPSRVKVIRAVGLLVAGFALQRAFSGTVALLGGGVLILVGSFSLLSQSASNPAQHWRLLNIAASLAGFSFAPGGAAFIAWSEHYYFHPEEAEEITIPTGHAALEFFRSAASVASIGVVLTGREHKRLAANREPGGRVRQNPRLKR